MSITVNCAAKDSPAFEKLGLYKMHQEGRLYIDSGDDVGFDMGKLPRVPHYGVSSTEDTCRDVGSALFACDGEDSVSVPCYNDGNGAAVPCITIPARGVAASRTADGIGVPDALQRIGDYYRTLDRAKALIAKADKDA